MAVSPVTSEPTTDELRNRITLAKSVLGHAPLYRAVQEALSALDGASLEDLCSQRDEPGVPPPGSREYLRGWHDGHDSGYAAALERLRQESPAN